MTDLANAYENAVQACEALRDASQAKLEELRGGPAANGAAAAEAAGKAANAACAALRQKSEIQSRLISLGL